MDQMLPTPGPELPKPEREAPRHDSGEYVLAQPDVIIAPPEAGGERITQATSAVAQATAVPVVIPIQPIGTNSEPTQSVIAGQASNPSIADDADVIEKEWVEKAKSIVAKTKDNPHEQSLELTSFRHDYMKKRYGKEIKLPDERAA